MLTIVRLGQAEELISREGLVLEGRNGPRRHPATIVAAQYRQHVRALGDRLGIGPAARANLPGIADADAVDGIELLA